MKVIDSTELLGGTPTETSSCSVPTSSRLPSSVRAAVATSLDATTWASVSRLRSGDVRGVALPGTCPTGVTSTTAVEA